METIHIHFGSSDQIVHNHFITPYQNDDSCRTLPLRNSRAKRYDDMMEYMEAAAGLPLGDEGIGDSLRDSRGGSNEILDIRWQV